MPLKNIPEMDIEDSNITFESIHKLAKQTEKQLLKSINLFDVYEGKNLPKGKKSYVRQ